MGTDTCSSGTVTHSDSETSGACSSHVVKVITRTWTVTDACGNSASQAQTITLKDTSAPSFVNFPTDATVECPGDTSPAATGAPTGTDTCSSGTVAHSDSETSGSCSNHVVKVVTRSEEHTSELQSRGHLVCRLLLEKKKKKKKKENKQKTQKKQIRLTHT